MVCKLLMRFRWTLAAHRGFMALKPVVPTFGVSARQGRVK
jgi:hypothetical protein